MTVRDCMKIVSYLERKKKQLQMRIDDASGMLEYAGMTKSFLEHEITQFKKEIVEVTDYINTLDGMVVHPSEWGGMNKWQD